MSAFEISAHVGLTGADLTQSQLAFQSAAGTLLPLLIWIVFISLVPRKSNFTIETMKLTSSMVVVNTLLTWIFIPILFMLGKAPSDDVMNFLMYSRMPALLLSWIALVLYAGGWILFLSKIDGLRNEFLMFGTKDLKMELEGTRTTMPIMIAILALCALLVISLNMLAAKNQADRFSAPQNFIPAAQIDLSTRPYSSETIAKFTLDKPSVAGVFIAIHNINTTFFDLSVKGPDGFSSIVLHGEGYSASRDGGLWQKSLSPGTYELVLTARQSPGTALVYLKTYNP